MKESFALARDMKDRHLRSACATITKLHGFIWGLNSEMENDTSLYI